MPTAFDSGSDIDSNGYRRVYPARPNSKPNFKGHTVRFLGGLRKGKKGRSPSSTTSARHTVEERGRGRQRSRERRSAPSNSEKHCSSPSLLLLDVVLSISLAAFGAVVAFTRRQCNVGTGKNQLDIGTEHGNGREWSGEEENHHAVGGRCVTMIVTC